MRRSYGWMLTVLLSAGFVAGCDVLKPSDSKDEKKNCTANKPAKPAVQEDVANNEVAKAEPDSAKGAAKDDADVGAENAESDKLPFDVGAAAGLWLKPSAPKPQEPNLPTPEPMPKPKPKPKPKPAADDPCEASPNPNPSPVPSPVPNPNPNPAPNPNPNPPVECSALGLIDVEEPNAGSSGATSRPAPPDETSGACATDTLPPKNVAPEGRVEALAISWKALGGLKPFGDAAKACAELGATWHLAEASEIDRLFLEPSFRTPAELSCLTAFWAGPPKKAGGRCVAAYRGYRYEPAASGLPFEAKARDEANNKEAVTKLHGVLCVEGRAKPEVACGAGLEQLFDAHPLGIPDPASGLTWARITIAEHVDAESVEKQCALGAAQGWRIPTAAELEAAIKADVFRTVAYGGKDATCRYAWHKSEKPTTTKTCASLGTGADGSISFFEDAACGAEANRPSSTDPNLDLLLDLAVPNPGTGGATAPEPNPTTPTQPQEPAPTQPTPPKAPSLLPLGLCVKAKA